MREALRGLRDAIVEEWRAIRSAALELRRPAEALRRAGQAGGRLAVAGRRAAVDASRSAGRAALRGVRAVGEGLRAGARATGALVAQLGIEAVSAVRAGARVAGAGIRRGIAGVRRVLHACRWMVKPLVAATVFLVSLELALAGIRPYLAWRYRVRTDGAADVVCLGDSVTFGFGLAPGEGWPSRLASAVAAAGGPTIHVAARARPAATSADVLAEQAPDLPAGALVLVMAGHNDFVQFSPGLAPARGPASLGAAPSVRSLPRVLRLLLFLTDADARLVSSPYLDTPRRDAFTGTLDAIDAAVTRQGGRLVILTYAVPGAPGAALGELQMPYTAVRDSQRAQNQLVRTWAELHDLPLVDVEALVPSGDAWDAAEFLDAIHPTAAVQGRIAAAVAAELIRQDLLAR